MADRTVEHRSLSLRVTLHADPLALHAAMRHSGLDHERVEVDPPMDEDDEADGSVDLTSLVELAAVLRHLRPPEAVRDAVLWIALGDPRSDPLWAEVAISGGGSSLRATFAPGKGQLHSEVRIRTDLLAGELSDRITRARAILAGKDGG